jgi:hypothetical protein
MIVEITIAVKQDDGTEVSSQALAVQSSLVAALKTMPFAQMVQELINVILQSLS